MLVWFINSGNIYISNSYWWMLLISLLSIIYFKYRRLNVTSQIWIFGTQNVGLFALRGRNSRKEFVLTLGSLNLCTMGQLLLIICCVCDSNWSIVALQAPQYQRSSSYVSLSRALFLSLHAFSCVVLFIYMSMMPCSIIWYGTYDSPLTCPHI